MGTLRCEGAHLGAARVTEGVGDSYVGSAAVPQPELLSLLALRDRAIRFWLAAIGLLAFGVGYAGPIGLPFRMPALSHPTQLPELKIPAIAFPTFGVPTLHAPAAIKD